LSGFVRQPGRQTAVARSQKLPLTQSLSVTQPMQVPLTQIRLPAHVVPHPPQFWASLLKLTQLLLQQTVFAVHVTPPQPPRQVPLMQVPFTHAVPQQASNRPPQALQIPAALQMRAAPQLVPLQHGSPALPHDTHVPLKHVPFRQVTPVLQQSWFRPPQEAHVPLMHVPFRQPVVPPQQG
jgi:hypothetical protein